MRLTLNRYGKVGKTVLGYIKLPNITILTLDDAEEMLPNGFYHLVKFSGIKYKNTWALVGECSSVYQEAGVARSTCLFHAGDTHEDTTGCVIVGLRYKFRGDTPDIDDGAIAMDHLRSVLESDKTHYLTIEGVS